MPCFVTCSTSLCVDLKIFFSFKTFDLKESLFLFSFLLTVDFFENEMAKDPSIAFKLESASGPCFKLNSHRNGRDG